MPGPTHTNIAHSDIAFDNVAAAHTDFTQNASHTDNTTPFNNIAAAHTNIAHSNQGFLNTSFSNIAKAHTNISHTDTGFSNSYTPHTNIGAAHTDTTINASHVNSYTAHQNVGHGDTNFVNSYSPAQCSQCPGGNPAECDAFCDCYPNCGCQDNICVGV